MNELILVGAYGRTASLTDWEKGLDFKIQGGPYCSIRDVDALKRDGYTHVYLCAHSGKVLWIVDLYQ